jgi:hypothetical protein
LKMSELEQLTGAARSFANEERQLGHSSVAGSRADRPLRAESTRCRSNQMYLTDFWPGRIVY